MFQRILRWLRLQILEQTEPCRSVNRIRRVMRFLYDREDWEATLPEIWQFLYEHEIEISYRALRTELKFVESCGYLRIIPGGVELPTLYRLNLGGELIAAEDKINQSKEKVS